MSELPHPATPSPAPAVLRQIEWIASDPESGVLRLRGEFAGGGRALAGAPVLCLRDESGSLTQRAPLNEDHPEAEGWRAAYLIAGALLGGAVEKWLEWPDDTRLPLPDVDVSAGDGRIPAPPPERGAEVFDRAVLAERRAQRAETAQRAQARTAEAAVAALGALERRVEDLTRERDALARAQAEAQDQLAARAPSVPAGDAAPRVRLVAPAPVFVESGADLAAELEVARTAQREAEVSERRHRQSLDEALRALGRLRVQAAEARLRMRIQVASASADAVRLAVLESERRGFRSRLADLRSELDSLRARVAGEEKRGDELAVALGSERTRARVAGAERDELRRALARERETRMRVERELASGRAVAREHGARVAELEAALAGERERAGEDAEALRRRVEDLGEQLRAERTARASLSVQLRVARASESTARAEAAARTAAQSRLRRQHAEAVAEAAAARTELATLGARTPASVAPEAGGDSRAERRLAELEAELDATRAALETARARLRRAAVAVASGPAPAASSPDGEAADSADVPPAGEPPRRALSADVAGQLRRRIAVFQDAAAHRGDDETTGATAPGAQQRPDAAGVAARLDAAAASLRAAVPGEGAVEMPERGEAAATAPAQAREAHRPAPEASVALAVREPSAMVVASPPDELAPDTGTRRLRSLRGALVRLAAEDAFAAARLLAALLPAQGAFLREDVDYDLTIRELGTFAVTVAGGRTSVRALPRPRSRREAPMHLTLHALTLAELLAGRPRRVGRLLSPVRLRGSRRGLEALAALVRTGPSLAEVVRAGAVLDPGLLVRVLPHVVDASDTEGHSFTVAQEIVERTTRTWYVTADGRRGLRVGSSPPADGCDARVTISRAGLERFLRGEPLEEHKPWIRGDFGAVEILRRWIDAARG